MRNTHTCIRTLAFTCECDADGNSNDAEIQAGIARRLILVAKHDEWQDACGQDALDVESARA